MARIKKTKTTVKTAFRKREEDKKKKKKIYIRKKK